MESKITTSDGKQKFTKQEKVISLFKFIEDLNKLKQKVVLNVSDYPWWSSIRSFPHDPENIKVYYRDRVEEEDLENISDVLLAVHKPEFQKCPAPDPSFENWLNCDWNDYHNEVKVKKFTLQPFNQTHLSKKVYEDVQKRIDEENNTYKVFFNDNEDRVVAFQTWIKKREEWATKQKVFARTRDFFSDLYKISISLDRDSEILELVVADGFIKERSIKELDHPILTRRVKIYHNAIENTIYIMDTDVETELNTAMFQNMDGINLTSINHMCDDLHQNDYHPLDRNELPIFFKNFIHQLSPESIYVKDDIPENWEEKERLLIYSNPCYILRKRTDGTMKAIEQIIDQVEKTGEVPAPIADIVDGGKIDIPEDINEISIEEQLASVGGESVDILLSKEANKEQLEIARRIEHYNAVLVQGPPGTGKTHTIANLMGHFLAHGKSVLVTSHTQKALTVLKEKVAPDLQNLCVSILDDSNIDMEKSIDRIISYMSQYTSFGVKKEMELIDQKRKQIIHDLADTRKKLFSIINQECSSIVYNGKDISPSDAAKFVQMNSEALSYIPGKVQLYESIPLSFEELSELYQSNEIITEADEFEFNHDLPNPEVIILPDKFKENCNSLNTARDSLNDISKINNWEIQNLPDKSKVLIKGSFGSLMLDYSKADAVEQLINYIKELPKIELWMQHCATDGKKGTDYKSRWLYLIQQIQDTTECSKKLANKVLDKKVQILSQDPHFDQAMKQLLNKFEKGEKISKFALMFNKQLVVALNGATVNGKQPQNVEDCQLILQIMEIEFMRNKCASYWNELIAKHNVPAFYDLDLLEPERVAANYIPYIQRYLDWFQNEYEVLIRHMNVVGLPYDNIFQSNPLDSEIMITNKIITALDDIIPKICEILKLIQEITYIQKELEQNRSILQFGKRICSNVCQALFVAAEANDYHAYRDAFSVLENTYAKTSMKVKRENYLNRLTSIAPQWANAIRNRDGIHGESIIPSNIADAWKWKQYYGIIEKIIIEPFSELQERSLSMSKEYRKITAKYAVKSAWYNLLRTTEHDISMKQALIGWKQTVKKIGKGTGKNAPMYRAKARELMVKCQNAVPGWIMPISKALESLNPRTNQFDIIIIDEASQSDISSLAILYMGKKLIIVGDDKQVSPMAVGVQIEKMNSLKQLYIEGKIPNAHLYDGKTSIYDIAATTFQPLMLHEHFRCVPEIIGFSNWLSYDFKIKPLRDCSNSTLLPAVVNYRVDDGERIGKTNPNEAKAIIALMQACMKQPEYIGKTFGIISLLGNEQVKKLQEEICSHIDPKDVSERRILCGNASNFQGDERDVIFLSMVDCANGNGPLSKQGFGVDDAYRKRYNVAVSRAKDQLWIVNSLDHTNDLKYGDIRKMLIEYSLNHEPVIISNTEIEKKEESSFESSVASFLTDKGYHLEKQWRIGAYHLSMVAVYGKKKVVIECDGKRWHNREDKIREDMERQTILERLGWQFIRIRGSEYYLDPNKTMKRVLIELNEKGIKPEETIVMQEANNRETQLLKRVKQCAYEIIQQGYNENHSMNVSMVTTTIDSKNDVIAISTEGSKQLPDFKGKEEMQKVYLKQDNLNREKKSVKNLLTSDNSIQSLSEEEKQLIDKVVVIPATIWFELSHWAKETDNFQPWQRKLLFLVGRLIKHGKKPSINQARHAMNMYKFALKRGFL